MSSAARVALETLSEGRTLAFWMSELTEMVVGKATPVPTPKQRALGPSVRSTSLRLVIRYSVEGKASSLASSRDLKRKKEGESRLTLGETLDLVVQASSSLLDELVSLNLELDNVGSVDGLGDDGLKSSRDDLSRLRNEAERRGAIQSQRDSYRNIERKLRTALYLSRTAVGTSEQRPGETRSSKERVSSVGARGKLSAAVLQLVEPFKLYGILLSHRQCSKSSVVLQRSGAARRRVKKATHEVLRRERRSWW